MEFLMTYGWALITMLILISGLYYFGVSNPKDILPDRCSFSPQIGCIAYSLTSSDNSFLLRLKNNVGEVITVTALDLNSEGVTNIVCTKPSKPTSWPNTISIDLPFTACNFDAAGFRPGKSVKLFVNLSYYPIKSGSSYVSNVQGEIITKVS